MLIGCISGPDFQSAAEQIERANVLCDGVELRSDILAVSALELQALRKNVQGHCIVDGEGIVSYHNFDETPADLNAILADLMKQQAPLYKISCMARTTSDSMRMLLFVRSAVKKGILLAGMCMGEHGAITRILGPVCQSALTFAAIEGPTAPGQLPAEELVNRYRFHSLSPNTALYGLIGHPVTQSPSHRTHNAFFAKQNLDAIYVKMDLLPQELETFIPLARALGFRGLSVTIPHKETILKYTDHLSDAARSMGAVNTLCLSAEGIAGENTDAPAALELIGDVKGKRLLILGAGGVARAIAFEAARRGAELMIWNRTFERAEALAQALNAKAVHTPTCDCDILINATPHENLEWTVPSSLVMDVNMQPSTLIAAAKERGCQTIDGLALFQRQAERQLALWFKEMAV